MREKETCEMSVFDNETEVQFCVSHRHTGTHTQVTHAENSAIRAIQVFLFAVVAAWGSEEE
jgi:hypothetical protein